MRLAALFCKMKSSSLSHREISHNFTLLEFLSKESWSIRSFKTLEAELNVSSFFGAIDFDLIIYFVHLNRFYKM